MYTQGNKIKQCVEVILGRSVHSSCSIKMIGGYARSMVDREDIHTGGMHRYVPSIYTDTEIPCVMYGDGTRMEILN